MQSKLLSSPEFVRAWKRPIPDISATPELKEMKMTMLTYLVAMLAVAAVITNTTTSRKAPIIICHVLSFRFPDDHEGGPVRATMIAVLKNA
ncbi:hypothetical protein V1508DRAFT_399587 [Lipomyces doorenjongii]|uniref:uncharacterized protein n=1 Tax=Lipomyces doorenjongii TaxID=383834 RepID=UPI0034D00196